MATHFWFDRHGKEKRPAHSRTQQLPVSDTVPALCAIPHPLCHGCQALRLVVENIKIANKINILQVDLCLTSVDSPFTLNP